MSARTYRALLIANSTFPNDPHNLIELEGPRNDPALLRDALCDRDAGLVPSDNVRLVTERTMAEVLREVEDFLSSASSADTLLLYYTGHGVLDQSNELFLCTRDTRSDRLRSTAVKASDIRQMIDESASGTTVILLDCCHSGRFKGGDIPSTLSGRGSFVVTSSRSGELANDTEVRNHASLFTHHLVQGLLHGAEDRDGDGVVNLSEVYDYVHSALSVHGRQVPQKRFQGDGDVPMALRPATVQLLQADLVDPAVEAPLLDVPVTDIDLGEVDADVALPPERLAIVNRGGGTLSWSVESSAAWVSADRQDGDLVMHLRPNPGPNRANIYVRDMLTGAIKTVRISVRVRPRASAPVGAETARLPLPVVEQPPIEQPPAEDTTSLEEPSRDVSAAWARRLAVVAGVLSIGVGMLIVVSSIDASRAINNNFGYRLILRRTKESAGLLWEMLAGCLLAAAGFVALRRRSTGFALGIGLGVGIPLGVDRWGAHRQAMSSCGCVGAENVFAFRGAAGLCLLAAGACVVAIVTRAGWTQSHWMSPRRLAVTAGLAVGWGAVGTIDFYRYFDDRYGSSVGGAATTWHMWFSAAIVVLVVVASRLERSIGTGVLVGVVAMPAFAVISEGAYIVGVVDEEGYSVYRVWTLVLVTTLFVGAVATNFRRTGDAAPFSD